jgi:hypothetical protein
MVRAGHDQGASGVGGRILGWFGHEKKLYLAKRAGKLDYRKNRIYQRYPAKESRNLHLRTPIIEFHAESAYYGCEFGSSSEKP